MPQTHSRACQLRWVAATWVLTVAVLSLYLIWLDHSPSLTDIDEYLIIAAFGVGTSLVAVCVLARLPHLAAALLATTAAGFLAGYAVGSVTYGTEGELQNGLMFRAFGGAILGGLSAIAAWLLLRLAHRFGWQSPRGLRGA